MSEFSAFLKLGFQHITDVKGFDHILFILALCAIYTFKDWRKLLVLVTAFTIGHSITLALATLQIFKVNSNLVEFLIPITIFLTCVFNFFYKIPERKPRFQKPENNYRYYMALFFGLIHGLGFSNYLRSLLGKEGDILKPLFAFNVGLEIGQIIIVVFALAITTLFLRGLNVKQNDWKLALSGLIAGMALFLIKDSAIFG